MTPYLYRRHLLTIVLLVALLSAALLITRFCQVQVEPWRPLGAGWKA